MLGDCFDFLVGFAILLGVCFFSRFGSCLMFKASVELMICFFYFFLGFLRVAFDV